MAILGKLGKEAVSEETKVEDSDQLAASARDIESQLADARELAIATLSEVCATAESAGVKLAAAKTILEMQTGSLRRKEQKDVQVGVTVETMNVLIQDAMKAYAAQTSQPNPPAPTLSDSVILNRN